MSNKKFASRDEWFSRMEKLSAPFKKYCSFFPEQYDLLEKIYEKLMNDQKKVWIFTAPPASGKTHVICLLARFLAELGEKTAIVVPSNYLKEEFERACLDVDGGLLGTEILNLSEYIKSKKSYAFVLVDEAHNLKSFLELDEKYVRTVSFSLDNSSQYLAGRYLRPNQEFVAQQLSFVSAKNLLDMLSEEKKYRIKLAPVLANPTFWPCFLYIWRESNLCTAVFVQTDGICKFNMPSKHIILFSATPLSTKELKFYCGIDQSLIANLETIKSSQNLKDRKKFCISIVDKLDFKNRLLFLKTIIKQSNVRTLVLFNNWLNCKAAFEELRKVDNNFFIIKSYSNDKVANYQDFLNCPNGVLLTVSTVFWEGITISGLQLVVIFDLPFPRPRLFDLVNKKAQKGQLDMYRRLRQGIGRVGRKKGELGLSIVLSDITKVGKNNLQLFSDVSIQFTHSYEASIIIHKIFADKEPLNQLFH